MPLLPPQIDRIDRQLLRFLRLDPVPAAKGTGGDTDWATLLHRAHRHQVLPLILQQLASLPPGGPAAPPEEPLRRLRRAWASRFLLQEGDLKRAARALAAVGVTPLALKGPAVGRRAYGDPALRASQDIDLLVPLDDYEAALGAVTAAGFEIVRQYPRGEHYHDVLKGSRGMLLELHWALSRAGDPVQLDPARFLTHGLPAGDSIPVRLTSPTDLLLHTASQAWIGRFSRLLWVVDVDRLLRRCDGEIDWERLREDAGRAGLAPALWLLFRLAGQLLGTPEPVVQESLAPRPWIRYGLSSITPGRAMVTGFSLHYNIVEKLYDCWLAPRGSARLRAAGRLLRIPPLKPIPGAPAATAGQRLRHGLRSLLLTVKALAYQASCLIFRPFRSD
jgi:hypothetical protein